MPVAKSVAAQRTFAAPRITFKDAAKAIEFYESAFGAKETFRFGNEQSIAHAEMTIGDCGTLRSLCKSRYLMWTPL